MAGAQAADPLVVAPGESLRLEAPPGTRAELAWDGGLLRPAEGTIQAPAEGEHWLAVVSRNGVGAVSPVRWVRVVVDTRAPRCEMGFDPPLVEHPAGVLWARPGTAVTLQAEDAPAGVDSVELVAGGTTIATGGSSARATLREEGPVSVTGRCLDRVGNRAVAKAIELGVDGTPPEGGLALDGRWIEKGGRIVASPTVTVHARWQDALSGVAAGRIAADGRWKEGTSLRGGWAEGDHVAEARAKDWAGNESTVRSLVFTVDATPPELQCRVRAPGATESGDIAWVPRGTVASCRAEDAVAGVESVEWSSDGASWKPTASGVPLGPHGVRVRAGDAVGNVREIIPPFRVDGVAPDIALAVPGRGEVSGNEVISLRKGDAVSIIASDGESGVGTVEYRVGRGPWSELHGPVAFRDRGSFVLETRAKDRAGNESLKQWRIRVVSGSGKGALR